MSDCLEAALVGLRESSTGGGWGSREVAGEAGRGPIPSLVSHDKGSGL